VPGRVFGYEGLTGGRRATHVTLREVLSALKRVLLWDYPRASWQYDVIVAVILLFIFLTPRDWFRDQPRTPQGSAISSIPASYWLEPELLRDIPDNERVARASSILRSKYNKRQTVTQLQPIYNSEHELQGFIVFARP